MTIGIIIFFIIVAFIIGIVASKIVDEIFEKKPKQNQIQEEPKQIIQEIKPEQTDVLIAIDKKLEKQNEHLATIRCYVGWLLVIIGLPIIFGLLGIGGYSVILTELLKDLS